MKLFQGGGKIGCRRGLGRILVLFLSSQLVISRLIYHTQCAQVHQLDGAYTIGGETFRTENEPFLGYLLRGENPKYQPPPQETWFVGYPKGAFNASDEYWNRTCPGGWEPDWKLPYLDRFYLDMCPNDITIRTYLVRQNGKVLRGWLHFEVEIDKSDEMEYIYLQTRDEAFNAIGEFVVDENEQCNTTKNHLLSPNKYQFFPCSATGQREAKTSGAIFMAKSRALHHKDRLYKAGYLPRKELSLGIHFTWRLNEYWCNRHQKIRLEVYVRTSRVYYRSNCDSDKFRSCRTKRKLTEYWIWPKWFGAADIKTEGSLNCTTPAINYTTGKLSPEADAWISKSTLITRGDDFINLHNMYFHPKKQYKSCVQEVRANMPTFGGRCREQSYKNVSITQLHGCNLNKSSAEFQEVDFNLTKFVVYSEYVSEIMEKRLRLCKQKCVVPNFADDADLRELQSYMKVLPSTPNITRKVSFKVIRDARKAVRDTTYWQTRKYHGNICIFLAMFFIPVSNFFIRYYKETFMHHLSLGCAPWFWFHLFVCIAVPVMYRSSYSAMQQNILNFGTSETYDAYLHRVGGYIFIWVFLLMVLLGALRPLGPCLRIMAMALHSLIGFGLYFLAIFLVVNSTWIPASPTLHACDQNGLPIGFSFTAKMAVAWLIIDGVFHILLTVFQVVINCKYKIERPGCGFPFVPMLPAESWRDLHGACFRKFVLAVYVSVAFGMTWTTIVVNFRNDDHQNCILGNMTCDLENVEPYRDSSPFGCLPISLNYYNKVYTIYTVNRTESE